jgi:anthranilate synthase/aminodeoxychorismate synthase-like glutamine amidotransferase
MKKVLIIDNYDSFTHTIKNYFMHLGAEVTVLKNDDTQLLHFNPKEYSHLVLSPGPGSPEESGYTFEIIKTFYKAIPILGVCLGHQAIIQVFGGEVIHAPKVMHGKLSTLFYDKQELFVGIEKESFQVMRYHSLVGALDLFPMELKITGWTFDDNEKVIMACQHKDYPVYGVQYHPESILSEYGYKLFENFLNISKILTND